MRKWNNRHRRLGGILAAGAVLAAGPGAGLAHANKVTWGFAGQAPGLALDGYLELTTKGSRDYGKVTGAAVRFGYGCSDTLYATSGILFARVDRRHRRFAAANRRASVVGTYTRTAVTLRVTLKQGCPYTKRLTIPYERGKLPATAL